MELILVTGLSGAGKRSVMGALEDLGCATLENVSPRLLEPLLELEAKLNPQRVRLALGMDSRHGDFAAEFEPMVQRLMDGSGSVHLLFVEASDATLLRRFSESRRPHPFAGRSGLQNGIARERAMMAPVRARATAFVDTSRLTLSQLRLKILDLLPHLPVQGTVLRLVSFGFKFGLPVDADVVLDARFLPNPYYVPELQPLTGRDPEVQDFLLKSSAFEDFLAKTENWIRWCWPLVQQEGRAYHTIAIGCTGGQHRSVALVESLAGRFQNEIPRLEVQHRELR